MDAINSIFDRIEIQGINTKQKLLYGYFFQSENKSKLESLKQALDKQQYSFVEIRKDDEYFMLHIEKIEQHTRESLFATKQKFINLAENYGVEYDGFDIGNIDSSKPLISDDVFKIFMNVHIGEELFQLGIKLYDLEIYDRAEVVFLDCLTKNINTDIVSYKLGNILSWQGKIEDGIKYLEQSVRLNPNYLDAWFNLGAICYDNHLFELSIKYYKQADKLKPNDEDIIYGISASQFAIQQIDEALENCKKVLKINPKNNNAKALLKIIKNNNLA
jgi:tetratricopeptide (TPR) repeat protein